MGKKTVSLIGEDVTLGQLIENEVLTEDEDGLSVTSSFVDSIKRIRTDIEENDRTPGEVLEEVTEYKRLIDSADNLAKRDSTPIALLVSLRKRLDIPETNCVQLIPVLDQLIRGPPESTDVPETFFPVRGDLLHLLIPVLGQGIVYVWRHDCNPCDLVMEDFEKYFITPPSDMALLAVYGPNWIDDVHEYDVAAGPTILFLRDGRIDARLVGAFPEKALVNEIEKIRQLS